MSSAPSKKSLSVLSDESEKDVLENVQLLQWVPFKFEMKVNGKVTKTTDTTQLVKYDDNLAKFRMNIRDIMEEIWSRPIKSMLEAGLLTQKGQLAGVFVSLLTNEIA